MNETTLKVTGFQYINPIEPSKDGKVFHTGDQESYLYVEEGDKCYRIRVPVSLANALVKRATEIK